VAGVSTAVRLGAVSYLNVRPLVFGLADRPEVSLRFDVPSECARLLAAGEIDLGMVPSITYVDRPGDQIVPNICIGSEGPVASVALFTRKPMAQVRSVALDTSSRTSAMLTRIICARTFGIRPAFVTHGPNLDGMLASADAALLIGDPALFADPAAYRATKIDLGAAWTAMTGLPFVWAFWSGQARAVGAEVVRLLNDAAILGRANTDRVADDYCTGDPARQAVARAYLRDNMRFALDARAVEGLQTYYREAHALGLIPECPALAWFPA
jgi:chorismate dehydratase